MKSCGRNSCLFKNRPVLSLGADPGGKKEGREKTGRDLRRDDPTGQEEVHKEPETVLPVTYTVMVISGNVMTIFVLSFWINSVQDFFGLCV